MQWRVTFWVMVGIQALSTGSVNISSPFLPLLIQQMGVHPLSLVETWAGFVQSAAFLFAAISSPIWGSLADRFGRKAMVMRANVAGTGVFVIMALATNTWELIGARSLLGMFAGFGGAATALVASVVPNAMLGFALGWLATAQMVGTLVGPLIGGVLSDIVHNYRTVFFCTACGTALSFFVTWLFVREKFERKPRGEKRVSSRAQLREILLHPEIAPLFVVLGVAQLSTLAVQPVVPLYIEQMVGPVPYLATLAGASFAVIGVGDLLASPWLGKRSDTLGYRRVLLISLLGAACFTIPQAFVHNVWVFLALRFGVGLFLGGIIPTTQAWIGRLFPAERRGMVYGLSFSASSFGQFCGPISGGVVAGHFGFGAVFVFTSTLILANACWVAFGLHPANREWQ